MQNNLWNVFLTNGNPTTYVLYSKSERMKDNPKPKKNDDISIIALN